MVSVPINTNMGKHFRDWLYYRQNGHLSEAEASKWDLIPGVAKAKDWWNQTQNKLTNDATRRAQEAEWRQMMKDREKQIPTDNPDVIYDPSTPAGKIVNDTATSFAKRLLIHPNANTAKALKRFVAAMIYGQPNYTVTNSDVLAILQALWVPAGPGQQPAALADNTTRSIKTPVDILKAYRSGNFKKTLPYDENKPDELHGKWAAESNFDTWDAEIKEQLKTRDPEDVYSGAKEGAIGKVALARQQAALAAHQTSKRSLSRRPKSKPPGTAPASSPSVGMTIDDALTQLGIADPKIARSIRKEIHKLKNGTLTTPLSAETQQVLALLLP